MKRWLGFPAVQIALGVACYGLVGYRYGVFTFLFLAPLFAVLMKWPLFALVANFRRRMLEQVWLPVHGQHYMFRDVTIHVLEDADHRRWVSLADVQKVLGALAGERTLATAYPGCLKIIGEPARPHIRDDALVTLLGKVNQPKALRFRTWVERNIAFPGRTVRARLATDRPAPRP